jgi:hypothetical protein
MQIVNNCEALHCLPSQGGLFDQDAYFMFIYNIVAEARAVKDQIERSKSPSK